MRQLAHNAERALSRAHVDSFLERARLEAAERQTLLHCALYFARGRCERDGKFPDGKPVDELARLSRQRHIHLSEELT